MLKPTMAFAALAFAALAGQDPPNVPHLALQEESLRLEYFATTGEIALMVEAEAEEALDHIEVRNPLGTPILRIQTRNKQGLALQGFVLESDEMGLEAMYAICPEGPYTIRARTTSGRLALGTAVLAHALVDAPIVTYPTEGALAVPATNLTVTWLADPLVDHYRIGLEQGETDRMSATLPGGVHSFDVPAQLLAGQTATRLELEAFGTNGNGTLVQSSFTTD